MYIRVKRILDIILAIFLIILLAIPMLIVAIAIKIEDGGPIIYKSKRMGKGLKTFNTYKFRSMKTGRKELESKLTHDEMVTKVGKFIRRTSLDELPQLWNVLIGDMSLVGPRPPLPSEVAEYTDYDKQRLTVMPGCTGLWQVTKRNEADFDEMVWLDIVYINHSGMWEDLKLIIKTVLVMIHPNGAY